MHNGKMKYPESGINPLGDYHQMPSYTQQTRDNHKKLQSGCWYQDNSLPLFLHSVRQCPIPDNYKTTRWRTTIQYKAR